MQKDQQVGGQYANVSCWRQFILKTTRFSYLELILLRNNLFTVHCQISNFVGCVHSLRAVLHTAWKVIFKNP